MKRITTLFLCLLMLLSLAACGGSSSSSSSAPAASSSGSSSSGSASSASSSAKWPSGAVTILCGFGAGGSSDLEVRSVATYLEKVTGGTFVVSNVTGANGWMAWDQLLHADKDGQTLAMVNTPALFYDYLDPSQGHKETMDDFDFICNEVIDYGLLVTKKDAYADINAFMDAAKAEGGVTVADVGANGNKHIAILQAGIENPDATMTSVHQMGWSDNLAALLGGTVDAVSATYGDVASVLADGEIEVLCVFNDNRIDVLPDVPTFEEAGYGKVYSAPARGYFLPKGVDAGVKDAIVAAFKEAIPMADHIAEMENLGLMVNYMDGDEYMSFLKSQEADVIALKPQLGW